MRSSALRWGLALAAAVGITAAARMLLQERELLRAARSVPPAERLSGAQVSEPEKAPGLALAPARRARPGGARRSAAGGLGARLVEGGRPRGPLAPLDAGRHLSAPAPRRASARELPSQAAPRPGGKAAAAARARAAAGARRALRAGYAPGRRSLPARAAPRIDVGKALLPPESIPRLGTVPRAGLPEPVRGPASERGKPVAAPKAAARLPAPVVPLEPGR